MPAGSGDPHIHRFDGTTFDFQGVPGRTYRLIEREGFQVRCTLVSIPGAGSGPRPTVIGDLSITVGEVTVAIPLDRKIRVWSPDFDVAIHALLCTLPAHDPKLVDRSDDMNSVPYINVDLIRHPISTEGMTGLMVDGDGSDECEARERLHDLNQSRGKSEDSPEQSG